MFKIYLIVMIIISALTFVNAFLRGNKDWKYRFGLRSTDIGLISLACLISFVIILRTST